MPQNVKQCWLQFTEMFALTMPIFKSDQSTPYGQKMQPFVKEVILMPPDVSSKHIYEFFGISSTSNAKN